MTSTDLSTTEDYQTLWQTSRRVNWDIQNLIGAGKRLDFGRSFLPDALARVNAISCLSDAEKRTLNQIRGNSYLYVFRLCEEFILPSVREYVKQVHRIDLYATQALLHFAEEESKHILLFRRFAEEFAQGFGTGCDCISSPEALCDRILRHHPLAVALITLHIEWMTQRHYLESVRENPGLDPQFCRLLRYHWLEEAQHAKLDALIVRAIAGTLTPQEIQVGIADYFKIIKLLEQAFRQQVQFDLESLSRAGDRDFSEAESAEIKTIQLQSYRWTFLWSGMTHQNVQRTFDAIEPTSRTKLFEQSKRFSWL